MTEFLSTNFLMTRRAADKIGIDTDQQAPVLSSLVERIVTLASFSETEISDLMQTEEGHRLVRLQVVDLDGDDPDRFASDWDSVAVATPGPLTDAEYQRMLHGGGEPSETEDSAPLDLFGAHIEEDR